MKKPYFLLVSLILALAVPQIAVAGYFEEGKTYYIYKKYDKAREMFLKRVEQGDHGDSYYFLGEIEKMQGNYAAAEEHFRKAIAIPSTTRKFLRNAHWNVIILTEQRSDYPALMLACKEMWYSLKDDGARSKMEGIINKYLWTDDEEAIKLYKDGMKAKENGDTETAQSLFKDALRSSGSFLAPKFELGIYLYKKGDMDGAARFFSDIAERIPFYSEVQLLMGNIHYDKKFYSSALEYFSKADEFGLNDNDTEYHILMKMANCNYALGELEDAVIDLERARKIRSSSLDPLLLQAAIMIKQENYDEALKVLLKAESLKPDNPAILFQIGSIYYSKKDWRYLSYFDRVNTLAKAAGDEGKYVRIIPILAAGYYEKKEYLKTLEFIGQARENMMTHEMRLMAAHSNFHLGRYDAAVASFEKISLAPFDQAVLCKVYARSGREDKAREIIERSLYNEEFAKEARTDNQLSRIIAGMDQERRQKEETLKQEEIRRQQLQAEQERAAREEREKKAREAEALRNSTEGSQPPPDNQSSPGGP
jgi:tetratricopeptide (TPR) repeat protein